MIRVECKPEQTLVMTLTTLPKKQIIHHSGKSRIFKFLQKSENCKALVDEDPGAPQPSYLKNLESLEISPEFDLKVLGDTKRNNLVIILCPKLEDWIIKSVKLLKINMEKQFNLPSDSNRLHRIINYRLPKIQRLIQELRKPSSRIQTLANFLSQSNIRILLQNKKKID